MLASFQFLIKCLFILSMREAGLEKTNIETESEVQKICSFFKSSTNSSGAGEESELKPCFGEIRGLSRDATL